METNQTTQPTKDNSTLKKSSSKLLIPFILAIVFAILGISAFVALFVKNSNLSSEYEDQKKVLEATTEKYDELEKELIFYKTGDLAKELEIVNLKLGNTQKELDETKDTLTNTEDKLTDLRGKVEDVPKIVSVLSLMYGTAAKPPPECYNEADKAKISQELNLIGDTSWRQLWNEFISNTTSSNCSNSPELLQKALDHGYQKILDIV